MSFNASIQLRSKKELIDSFVASVNADTNVDDDWKTFVREQKEKDISTLIILYLFEKFLLLKKPDFTGFSLFFVTCALFA